MQKNKKTIRKGKRQKAWQYMRRNPMFSVKDILILLEMSENSLMIMVRQLVNAKYLKQIRGGKTFKNRSYKLIKNTGIVCPTWIDKQGKLFDANINAFGAVTPEYIAKEAAPIESKPVSEVRYAADRLMQILSFEKRGVSKKSLQNRSGVPVTVFDDALSLVITDGDAVYKSGLYRKVIS